MFSPSLIFVILQCLPGFPFCFFHSFLKVLLGAVFPLALQSIYRKGHLAKLLHSFSLVLPSSPLLLLDPQFSSRSETLLFSTLNLGGSRCQCHTGGHPVKSIFCAHGVHPYCLVKAEALWSASFCRGLLNGGTSTCKPCLIFVPFRLSAACQT